MDGDLGSSLQPSFLIVQGRTSITYSVSIYDVVQGFLNLAASQNHLDIQSL